MPSISHRAGLGQGSPHRATFGPAALPAGIVRAVIRWCRAWLEVRQDLRRLEEHVVHDVGFQLRPAGGRGRTTPIGSQPTCRLGADALPNQTRTRKED
jgi:hypothetical protein